jgi:hypothetical protein
MSVFAVFWNVDKAFDTTWHSSLLHKLTKLQFSFSQVKLIRSFLSERKFIISVEGKSPRVDFLPQHSFLIPLLYNLYTNDIPKHQVHIHPSLQTIPLCTPQVAERIMFSASHKETYSFGDVT